MLVRHGYGVLLFDRRGEGESDGDPNAFGWAMDRDLKAAAAFLQHRPEVEAHRIGGIGLSVGGEMLLQTAAESKVFRAVVSEGAGARSIRENLEKPRTLGGLTELGVSLALTAGTALFSNHMPSSTRSTTPQRADRSRSGRSRRRRTPAESPPGLRSTSDA
jgi:predicted alpha/beta hydrolase